MTKGLNHARRPPTEAIFFLSKLEVVWTKFRDKTSTIHITPELFCFCCL